MASFNTTVRQMIKIFQWPKCFSEKKNPDPSVWEPIVLVID